MEKTILVQYYNHFDFIMEQFITSQKRSPTFLGYLSFTKKNAQTLKWNFAKRIPFLLFLVTW